MHSNRYIFLYSIAMVVLVAAALTVVAIQLKPAQENNIRVEKMQNILASVHVLASPAEAESRFKQLITREFVVNSQGEEISGPNAFTVDFSQELKKAETDMQLPVYVANMEDGSKKYIVPLRGKGLWGPVWGYISFEEDFNTICGTMFDHKSETPGLGAEINTPFFQDQFKGKKVFDPSGEFTSVQIVKGGAKPDNIHGVDAISGGTITSKGVEDMISHCLTLYSPYFKTQQKP